MKSIATVLMLSGALAAPGAFGQATGRTAFVDVNVVPMDRDRMVTHQTVVVSGTSIETMGPTAKTPVPAGAERVEGRGTAFLFPGLADMHTHVMDRSDLALYTANGVTTILHMGEAPADLVASANQEIDRGELVGPRVFFSLLVDGSATLQHFFVATPEQGRCAADLAKTNGYDFIKLYNNVTAPEFEAIVDEAYKQGIYVIGHGIRAVGLPRSLFEGQVMVAHAEEFYYTAFQRESDLALIPSVVSETRRSGAFVTPNLSTIEIISKQWGKPEVVKDFLHDPRTMLMSPNMRQLWANRDYVKRTGSIEPMVVFLRTLTKALQDAGVSLLTGTDSPVIPGMYPGYSIHDDIRTLINAGLTPYQALTAATRTPGEFIAKFVPTAAHFGTIATGMRADLILLDANPLENVETLNSPRGVMTAGRWRSAMEMGTILDRQKQAYDALLK
jgi:hypothetical protein